MAASVQPPPDFEKLSVEEKIAYVSALWDLIADEPEGIPVPEWHEAIIRERLAQARAEDADVRSWADVRTELQARLRAARR